MAAPDARPTAPRWRTSFVTRLSVLYSVVLGGVIVVFGLLQNRAGRDEVISQQQGDMAHRAEVVRVKVQSEVRSVTQDLLFLSKLPALNRLAAAGAAAPENRPEVLASFQALLEERPSYFQARLIGVADSGREIIRIDQEGGRLRVTPPDQLQQKGDRDYFQAALRLGPDQFHLSDINLNQDFGRITLPQTPTLRASLPVRGGDGGVFGVLVINVAMKPLFDEIRTMAGRDLTVLLCNEAGDYLMHPVAEKCFGFDLGRRHRLADDYPAAAAENTEPVVWSGGTELLHLTRFPLLSGQPRLLGLALTRQKAPLLASLQGRRLRGLLFTGLLAALAVAAVVIATNLLARRLHQLGHALEAWTPGGTPPALPEDSGDETGLVVRKFREMAGKIDEQVRTLEEARAQAEAATRAEEAFWSTMSHEIRTPMNAVLGMTHLLDQGQLPAQEREWVDSLKFAGQHLMALLNNALDAGRISAGQLVLDPVDFALPDLLRHLHRGHEPLASRRGLTLALHLAPGLPDHVQGDATRLFQILGNFLHNALKFTTTGGITLSAAPAPEGRIAFTVEDTGPGLPSEIQEALAQPHPELQGRGLLIARELVTFLGGHLAVQTSPAGTRFSFDLPLPASGEIRSAALPAWPDWSGRRVLVVEDVLSNQTVLAAFLDKTGLTVDFADTVADGLARAGAADYDLALLDLQLPDGDGISLARALRHARPGLPLLVVSAQTSAGTRDACLDAGCAGLLPKPVDPRELIALLGPLLTETARWRETVGTLFDHDPAKTSFYFALLAAEFDRHHATLTALATAPAADAYDRLLHRLKNAATQLQLDTLTSHLAARRIPAALAELARLAARCRSLAAHEDRAHS